MSDNFHNFAHFIAAADGAMFAESLGSNRFLAVPAHATKVAVYTLSRVGVYAYAVAWSSDTRASPSHPAQSELHLEFGLFVRPTTNEDYFLYNRIVPMCLNSNGTFSLAPLGAGTRVNRGLECAITNAVKDAYKHTRGVICLQHAIDGKPHIPVSVGLCDDSARAFVDWASGLFIDALLDRVLDVLPS